ncbi:hypothetical protein SAMN05444369_10442 [Capnocytophaga haemolytica]|uniref:Uncharacterized protein n=1 Tax=Capnocytophaga haemolytica TaxID=45243 RepID=A0AAX2H1K5_9FLAO|nr:DUF6261 family protein [Capnocytophaga haemolytica]AMD85597.1 hypothetical protein AXF12_08785 [Capnocytophaga haemolytica]SFN88342.1 hypothetical protein SAMN05444369_10442 [Capnocytophaga haemolytica]SNV16864.1 Uncharacterised protein [Capnocytophaga haemolytica]
MKEHKLISVNYTRLRNAEFGQFFTRLFQDLEKSEINLEEDESLKEMFETLKQRLPNYDKSLEQTRGKEESKKIVALDKVRDNAVQALRDSIRPYKRNQDETYKSSYDTIYGVLEKYKGLEKENYEEESKDIDILLTILRNSDNKAHVDKLRIKYFIDELEKANKSFNETFAHRSFKTLQADNQNIKLVRKEIAELYNTLSNYVLSMAKVKKTELFIKLLDVINNSRKYYADLIARR